MANHSERSDTVWKLVALLSGLFTSIAVGITSYTIQKVHQIDVELSVARSTCITEIQHQELIKEFTTLERQLAVHMEDATGKSNTEAISRLSNKVDQLEGKLDRVEFGYVRRRNDNKENPQ